jgi:tetratricopeptide (TPR) repeat protein
LYLVAEPYFPLATLILALQRTTNLTRLAFLSGTRGTMARNFDNAARAVTYFREESAFYDEAVTQGLLPAHEERVAGAYEQMALATQQLRMYDEAFVWHAKNISILEESHSEKTVDLAIAWVNKSWALCRTGRWDEAEGVLIGVLKTVESNDGEFQARRA